MAAAAVAAAAAIPAGRAERQEEPLLDPALTHRDIDAIVAAPLLDWRYGRPWWLAFLASGAVTLGFVVGLVWLFVAGIGILGNNTGVVWGVPRKQVPPWFGVARGVWRKQVPPWIGVVWGVRRKQIPASAGRLVWVAE